MFSKVFRGFENYLKRETDLSIAFHYMTRLLQLHTESTAPQMLWSWWLVLISSSLCACSFLCANVQHCKFHFVHFQFELCIFFFFAYSSHSATVCALSSFYYWTEYALLPALLSSMVELIDVDSFLLLPKLLYCIISCIVLLPCFSISWLWPLFLFWKLNQMNNDIHFHSDQLYRLILSDATVGKIPRFWISRYFDVSPTACIRLWSHM